MSFSDEVQVLVGGSVAIDHVKTPRAEGRDLLGGSAPYAALAASKQGVRAGLLGIAGQDFPMSHLDMLVEQGVDLEGLERSQKESFTWSGEYHENLNERTTHEVALGVLEDWQPKVPEAWRQVPFVVLANMSPDNQMQVLDQLEEGPRLVLADTMDLWIEIARPRLLAVLGRIDVLVLNDGEARELTGEKNLIRAGRSLQEMGPRWVVIKQGEYGADLFGKSREIFRCSAWPLEEVADPTGAGDTFLGGLAGHLAREQAVEPSFEQLREGVAQGTVLASFCCEDFSTRRLERVEAAQARVRREEYAAIGKI